MGADLYIEKMDEKSQILGFEVSDNAVSKGYFRDCYNPYGLFAVMSETLNVELSWWQTSDRKELFKRDDEGLHMTVKGTQTLLSELEPLVKKFKNCDTLYYSEWRQDKKVLNKKRNKEYKDWADLLIKFLKLAIKNKSRITWSV